MSEQRVLIFMPTYEEGGIIQAFPESVESFYDLDVPEGWKADWVIGLDNPYGREGRHKNTLHQYQQIQRRVLDEGYDALVTFEHDMLVPKDGLVKLLEVDAPIVYGLYMLRHGAHCVNAFLYIEKNPSFSRSFTYLPKLYAKAERDGMARVTGVGMGFTLFRRKVLELFNFRATEKSYPPDWAIAYDSAKYGLKQICRFDVKCGHIGTDGRAIYPRLAGYENMAEVKVLQQFYYKQPYKPGTIAKVPDEKLDDFLRAGFVELISFPEEAPAVKITNRPTKKSSNAIKNKMAEKQSVK